MNYELHPRLTDVKSYTPQRQLMSNAHLKHELKCTLLTVSAHFCILRYCPSFSQSEDTILYSLVKAEKHKSV